MSSATSGEPPTPFSQKYTPTNLLDDWEVDVSCIPGRKARTEKLFALVEKTYLMHGKIYRALRNEIEHPSLSSETFCLSFIKLHNELIHLRIVKRTESFLRDRDDYNRVDRQGYDPEIDAYEMQVWNALGEPPHRIYDDIQPYIDRLQRLGYGRSFDPELEFWLYRRSAYYPRYSVPGVSEDYTWKLFDLRDKFLESARGYLDFDKMVPKAVVSGHWYHPSPVVSNYCSWPSNFAIRDYLVRKYDEVKVVKIKRLIDVCNSFVVELATITEAAQLPNYATLQRAATDSTWLSPSLNWVHSFLDRTREGLTGRGRALAKLILPQTLICPGYYPGGPRSRGLDYYTYRRLLGETISGNLGRLYLDLAPDSPRMSWTAENGVGMRLEEWRAKTLAYPEVTTLQSVCFVSFPMFQSSLEANPLTKCSLMTTH